MYIDPGAGSLILQVLVAGLLAVGAGARTAREAVKRFFQRLCRRKAV